MLDICTVEIPDGETLPEGMQMFGMVASDIRSDEVESLADRSSSMLLDSVGADQQGENNIQTTTEPEDQAKNPGLLSAMDSFPVLHNVHIKHRRPNQPVVKELDNHDHWPSFGLEQGR